MLDVGLRPSMQIVDAQHLMTLCQKTVDEMRSDKSGATGHQDTFSDVGETRQRPTLTMAYSGGTSDPKGS